MLGFVIIVGAITAMSMALTVVEFRKIKPLVFACRRCGVTFRRAAHHDYPARCPACEASNWAD
ncbi:MAG TPA: hypothetical protein VGC41_17955 [Kofleriaceae bacterium]